MKAKELKEFLDHKAALYEAQSFIKDDPILLPHRFERKEDIEIIGFLVATIAWGNRLSIIKSGERLVELLEGQPYDFVRNHQGQDLDKLSPFVHRTFQQADLTFFLRALQALYQDSNLEQAFHHPQGVKEGILKFRELMLQVKHEKRSEKHLSNPDKGSAAKRLHMYLRWMVRSNSAGVDFGIWPSISPADLYCPLDVHSGRVARKLGLLKRKANDWRAAEELRHALLKLDSKDPVKYDFALFGLGVFEKF